MTTSAKASEHQKLIIIGSGPAGMACAQQLARAGHDVHVYEKQGKAGGLLRGHPAAQGGCDFRDLCIGHVHEGLVPRQALWRRNTRRSGVDTSAEN